MVGAPLVGLLAQPIVGTLSDQIWTRWGRRQPFFLAGAGLAAIALMVMPNATHLGMAVGLYWLLQLALNIGVAPARPFVGDMLPISQRTLGYSIQSFCIGLGTVVASALPWLLAQLWPTTQAEGVPLGIKLAYYIGAGLCLGGAIWTFVTVQEPPPDGDYGQPHSLDAVQSSFRLVTEMPPVMRQLGWVQVFTWIGIYTIFLYFPTAVAIDILGAPNKQSVAYAHGVEWAGLCIAVYNLLCLGFSSGIPALCRRFGRVTVHASSLLCGGVGLMSLMLMDSRYPILLAMIGIGIAWASILAIPYALLMDAVPIEKSGAYMGLFNVFVVLPQIVVSLGFGWIMGSLLGGDRTLALAIGGACMGLAALLMLRLLSIDEPNSVQVPGQSPG
ncbi:MFS transporter [filamentous cyanobacterium CCP5]|nr:MFS transporter [filamentous cyanobacterium CCP5]